MNARSTGLATALLLALVTGCAEHSSPTSTVRTDCSGAATTTLALDVGAYTAIDPATDSGCVTFTANGSTTDSAEYLVIAQSAGGPPGDSGAFQLSTPSPLAGASAARLRLATVLGSRGSVSAKFEAFLHKLARNHGAGLKPPAFRPRAQVSGRVRTTVTRPMLDSLRTFAVCATLDCSSFTQVTARVRAVGAHVAVYVDTLAPAGGLDSADIDTLAQTFDTHVYDVDTAAFGGVSDIDSNGVVLAVMTPVVNKLVTAAECNSGGYVSAFFFPPDLDPSTASQYNDGEIFYTVVADPNGTLSCPHTVADVEISLPGTMLHELQHIISFNQHVLLRGGQLEDLWLDEALSSYAEELGAESFLPDNTLYSEYVSPDLYNAYQYLGSPGSYFLLQTGDTVLAEFGGGWLYVQYLVDQFGGSMTHKLETTTLVGTANVAAQTGLPFATTVTRWALANWVSDLPGFTPPPELTYTSWSFRQVFASFHQQDPFDFPTSYPLTPVTSAGALLDVSGYLRAGSPTYALAVQGPRGAAFTLQLTGAGSGVPNSVVVPRLVVLRLR